GLERPNALLVLGSEEELRGRASGGDEGARPADGVLEAQQVGSDDLEDPADALDSVEPGQVEGYRDRALLLASQAAQPTRLGGVGGALGVMGEAVEPIDLWAGPAEPAVGHRERAG